MSVKKNFIYNTIYQLLTFVLPLITTPYLSRVLGAEGIGTYSYSYSIAKYFVLFAMLGLNNYGNRTVASIRDNKSRLNQEFSSIYYMQCIVSAIVIFIYIVFLLITHASLMGWIMALYVISSILDVNWFFFGLELFKVTVTRNMIIKISSVILILVLVKNSKDLFLYGLIMSMSFIVSQLAIWPFIKRYVRFVRVSKHDIWKHFKPNLILFVPVIAVSLYKIMDKIMLGTMIDMTSVGYYESAENIISIPIALVQSLGTVMLPKMSNLLANKKMQEGNKYIKNSLIFVLFLATSLSFGIMGISKDFVPFFYGKGFEPCIQLFLIFAPSCIFIAIANVIRTQYLIPMCEDKIYICSVFLGAIVNVILNILLIPTLKSSGAAIGTLVAEAVVCIYQMYKVRFKIDYKTPIMYAIPFMIAGIGMFLLLYNLKFEISSVLVCIILKVLLGIAIYFVIVICSDCIRRVLGKSSMIQDVLFKRGK